MNPASLLAVFVFVLAALMHLMRLVFGIEVVVGGWVAPMWSSVVGFLVATALAFALWRESRPAPA